MGEVGPRRGESGTAKQIDTAALVVRCETYALYRACMDLVLKDPELAVDKIWRAARNGYAAQWTALAGKLGLTPADRARLRVGSQGEDKLAGVSGFARKRA